MEIRRHLPRLIKQEYFWLSLIVILTLLLHLSTIYQPSDLILDEQHYVADARSIIQNHSTLRPEHPPLGKLFIALGIVSFGDNPIGWRIFSVVFGTISTILFYLICRELGMSRQASNIGTFLIALENLTFLQASVAMLDVFSVTFMFASFLLYLKGKYPFAAMAVGLTGLAKMTGLFALGAILGHFLITRKNRLTYFFASMLLTPISFVLFMPVFDFIVSHQFLSPITRIKDMLSLMSSLTFATVTHESLSRPWEWVLLPKMMPYWYVPRYVAAISFTVWALIIPTALYMSFRAKKGHNASVFGTTWFLSTYLVWIPLSIITDRISFVFYFYPTVGAICIGLGLILSQLISMGQIRRGKLGWLFRLSALSFLILHVLTFIFLSPVFT